MDEVLTEQFMDGQQYDTHIRLPIEEAGSNRTHLTDIHNGTLNMFLNDLYNREVDIKSNFSEQELLDIRTAADQQVNLLAETIGELDPRLRINEVLPVGSAREGTQIVRPCEYDYILILEALSMPGAVSLKFYKDDRQFMFVTPEDKETRSLFHGWLSANEHIKASGEFFNRGLRWFFHSSVAQAVILCSKRLVVKNTGTLTCKRTKPKTHGPAFPVIFEWNTKCKNNEKCLVPMKISVDLCPALRVDWEVFNDSLQAIDCDVSVNFKHNIQTVMI